MIEFFTTQAGNLRRIAAVSVCFFVLLTGLAKAQQPQEVLVLNSYHRGHEGADGIMNGIESTFTKNYPAATLHFEYFDTKRYDPYEVFPHMEQWLKWKYTDKDIKFDVIIACDNASLDFLRIYRDELFGKVPIVFVGINKFQNSMIEGMEPITGLVETYDKEATIEVALKFHPWAEKLVIVTDSKRDYWQDLGWIISRFEKRIQTTSLEVSDMTVEQFLSKLSGLDSKTIVLLPWGLSDVNDVDYTGDLMKAVFQNCAGPIYTSGQSFIGKGPIGGCTNSSTYHGELTAQMAIRILKGESASNIPIIDKSTSDWYFDYNQLRRWEIPVSELPPRSTIINEPQSFYYRQWKIIWLIVGTIGMLSLVVLVLSANIVRRRQAEGILRRRLELEKTISVISSRFVGESDINGAIDTCLADMGKLSGASRAYVFIIRENGTIMDNTHEWCAPDVSSQKQNLQNIPTKVFPWLMGKLRKDEIVHIDNILKLPPEANAEKQELEKEGIKSLLMTPFAIDNELAGFIGFDNVIKTGLWNDEDMLLLQVGSQIISNAFKRHRAEQKLLDYQGQLKAMASELSLTEERERRRIATELHDRISQSLVISKMTLEQLLESEASEHIAAALDDVCNLLGQTIENSRLLTFDLSSPILNELGFETAVAEWLTEEIQRKHNIAAEFEDDGNSKPLDDDIRAMLFRMVRELLINVVKHSQASKVKVSLGSVDSEIRVCVEDNGVGFEPAKVTLAGSKRGGFGLFSIRERLEQLGGRFEIKSSPGRGCTVSIAAPLRQMKV